MAIDVVVEEVADNLEEIADATRRINTNSVSFFLGGAAVGLVVGFYLGYRYNKEKIKAEAFKQSEEEVAKIREVYQQKAVVSFPKPSVEEIVVEKGYDRPLRPPVPVTEPMPVPTTPKDPNANWDFKEELDFRTENPDDPYILHQTEFMSKESGYPQVVYTYYAIDDVLVDEGNGHPLPHADEIVGLNNLRFGHGSDDEDVVYVRNNDRELEMEIVRVVKSYEEEVLGVENSETDDDDSD